MPPLPNAFIVPFVRPQVAEAGIAFNSGAGPLIIVAVAEFIQPAASFTFIV